MVSAEFIQPEKKKILLVEDEAIIAMLETRQLVREGYSVTHVYSGEKAVELMNSGNEIFDIILIDIDLGQGMDGTDAASEILKNHEIPVIFLSSHTEKEIVDKTEKITSYGYVVKNSGIRVLDASIKMACRLFEAHRELKIQKQNMHEVNADLQRTVQEIQAMNEEFEAANEQLIESERMIIEKDYLLNLTGSIAKIGGWEFDIDTLQGSWTDEVSRIHEVDTSGFVNVDFGLNFYRGVSREKITEALKRAVENGIEYDLELEMVTARGNHKWVRTIGIPVKTGDRVVKVQGTIQDITDRKKVEAEVERLNRLYLITSQINQMVVHTRDIERLLSEICRITVDTGNFRMAWIGLIDKKKNYVMPKAWAGAEDGYLSLIKKITLKDEPEGRGPTGTAIREGRFFYCNDIENDPCMAPWREEALKRGYRSSVALPIVIRGKQAGAFSIYSAEPFFFNKTELQMLQEIVSDVSYAIEMLEAEKQREKAENDLRLMISHREILMKELQHRVKNNLNVISGLLQLEEKNISDTASRNILLNAQNRIRSMTGIYERLYLSSDLENIELHLYIKDLSESIFSTYSIDREKIRLNTELEDLKIETKRAVPLGLILNELITNAIKYAYTNGSKGEINIGLKKNDGLIELNVHDNGCGLPHSLNPYTCDTMGLTLVRMLTEQIGGNFHVKNGKGTMISINFKSEY
jgi:two-component sensor histidine kinase/DNA-binding response OmpR family regulator